MCGIAGLIDPARRAREVEGTLRRMTSTLFHRGPDDEGTFIDDGVGLGMRRLAIIDVATGQQPVSTEDGMVQVVFNGEIYNFLELRAELARAGHRFRTRSDSEVIAHMYEAHGADFLTRLRGMFAIALWDRRARRLLLARDRMGMKPLFYALRGDRLLFGSEVKALLAAEPELAEPDPCGLAPYLRFGFVPEPRTMFRDVQKLPAAHFLVHEAGATRIAPYWTLRFEADPDPSPGEWRERLDAELEEAVRVRLMSEVPLGAFLSGGIDSSAVVAYMRRIGVEPLRTFTIAFDRPEWDESEDAAAVATRHDTDHHVLRLREEDLAATLPETLLALVRQFDEPFGDSSALPTYHVSRLAREHVTVILSGDGGDELFAGYPSYRGLRFAEGYRRLPAWLGQEMLPALARSLAKHLPLGRRYEALRVAKVLHDSALPFPSMYLSKSAVCAADEVRRVLTEDARLALAADGNGNGSWPPAVEAVMHSDLPSVSKASYADFRFRLLDDMLVKVDRMSMAHGLEVRCPLLDHRLVELVSRMPPAMKLRGFETKAIFRDTVRPYVPARTLRKRKQGFSVPLRAWLRTRLREMVGDYLEAGGGRLPSTLFDRDGVAAILAEHQRGAADHSQLIWSLLNYAAWQELYVARGGRPD